MTVRPAPDTMARLTTFAPIAQAVAAYATLLCDADALIASGDARSRGQIMTDLAIERLTGQAQASDVPLEINLVMTDEALLGGTARAIRPGRATGFDEPALLSGYGPIPAALAHDLIARPSESTPRWLRRASDRPPVSQPRARVTRTSAGALWARGRVGTPARGAVSCRLTARVAAVR